MALTDEEYLLLEQLTYLDSSVYKTVKLKKEEGGTNTGFSVEEILQKFTHSKLAELESHTEAIGTTHTSGKEWAELIRAIQGDKKLSSLIRTDEKLTIDVEENGHTTKADIAYVYVEKGDTKNAIVIFKGTTGPNEWADDVYAMGVSDSPSQLGALNFINGLNYSDITAVGHSKGGNKAQYVGITSDKVSRAISFDGEGFSKQFLDKYKDEISVKAENLTCYAVESDFVHELGAEISGADYKYVKGVGIEDLGENHCSNSFFTVDDDGNVSFQKADNETLLISMIRSVTVYIILESQKNGDWAEIEPTLEKLAKMIGGNSTNMDAMVKNISEALSDTEALATILAYAEQKLDSIDHLNNPGMYNMLNQFLKGFLGENLGNSGGVDWKSVLKKTTSKKMILISISKKSKHDFSIKKYNAVKENEKEMAALPFTNMNIWSSYASEPWYTELQVVKVYNYVNSVENGVEQANIKCVNQVKKSFENVQAADTKYAAKLEKVNQEIRAISERIGKLSDQIVYKS